MSQNWHSAHSRLGSDTSSVKNCSGIVKYKNISSSHKEKIYFCQKCLIWLWGVVVSKLLKLLQRSDLNFPWNYHRRVSTTVLWFVSVCVLLTERPAMWQNLPQISRSHWYQNTCLKEGSEFRWKYGNLSKLSGRRQHNISVLVWHGHFFCVLPSFMLKWEDRLEMSAPSTIKHCSIAV